MVGLFLCGDRDLWLLGIIAGSFARRGAHNEKPGLGVGQPRVGICYGLSASENGLVSSLPLSSYEAFASYEDHFSAKLSQRLYEYSLHYIHRCDQLLE
jgi:hypothetical protein